MTKVITLTIRGNVQHLAHLAQQDVLPERFLNKGDLWIQDAMLHDALSVGPDMQSTFIPGREDDKYAAKLRPFTWETAPPK